MCFSVQEVTESLTAGEYLKVFSLWQKFLELDGNYHSKTPPQTIRTVNQTYITPINSRSGTPKPLRGAKTPYKNESTIVSPMVHVTSHENSFISTRKSNMTPINENQKLSQ
jgi:hypothetical protein